ncbi:hypothetical protein SHIRM173S_03379 [Streptomyces hirsutus]
MPPHESEHPQQGPGTVMSVTQGEAMASVEVRLAGGQNVTAAITVMP